ncbi:hypothetical protein [Limnofasciculus baicalensis]|uniref:Uncharacterized protein n=1 Tax=Limnofasciculus baicalensis BBK-W-15 TaxID=2699891 RepID=A0AAE3GZJ8_9CYAN|nr:hypothetical protein [Limnofasciculus baicalensis]MCP2732693.1 hypothetical protein [Limnofasciculus baicalensis BBK-W-15]
MLTQFRVCYPQGSLLSELLTIDRGMYIVRCLVQVEGTTLATGMAADQTVELAEDRARSRAIAALCLDDSTTAKPKDTLIITHSAPVPSTPSMETAFSAKSVDPVQPTQFTPTPKRTKGNGMPLPESGNQITHDYGAINQATVEEKPMAAKLSVTEVLPSFEAFEEIEPPQVESPEILMASTNDPPSQEVSVPSPSPAEFDPTSMSNLTPDIPMDMSEVMARTTVEMKRLGWTTQRGRDYLMETYGKRSRHMLKDDELIAFLRYLESEPSPD